jgi:FixJ family two-component response regulator
VTQPDAVVFIVDDDAAMRRSLENLIRSVALRVEAFGSPAEFLGRQRPDVPACLVLDVRLPGLSGLDVQKRMAEAGVELPIVFITGHPDVPMSVRAIKAGAIEFLAKPFREQDLLDASQQALEHDGKALAERKGIQELRGRFDSLTLREREVMGWIAAGLLNKQIAGAMGTSETTVKVHRHHVMEKMRAGSVADLVRMADRLGVAAPKSQPD